MTDDRQFEPTMELVDTIHVRRADASPRQAATLVASLLTVEGVLVDLSEHDATSIRVHRGRTHEHDRD